MSVHLLLSAGRGPQECAWALARLSLVRGNPTRIERPEMSGQDLAPQE